MKTLFISPPVFAPGNHTMLRHNLSKLNILVALQQVFYIFHSLLNKISFTTVKSQDYGIIYSKSMRRNRDVRFKMDWGEWYCKTNFALIQIYS